MRATCWKGSNSQGNGVQVHKSHLTEPSPCIRARLEEKAFQPPLPTSVQMDNEMEDKNKKAHLEERTFGYILIDRNEMSSYKSDSSTMQQASNL
jgi:hypothetical protein